MIDTRTRLPTSFTEPDMDLEILSRTQFAGGHVFDGGGAYELIRARAHHAVSHDAPIEDLALAPRDAQGQVRFDGDVTILRPVGGGNRRIFFDWGNRGNLRALQYFCDAPGNNTPTSLRDAGNGYLFRRGYSVVFAAWQGDILPGDGRLLLDLPALDATGWVRSEFLGRPGLFSQPLSGWTSTRSHRAVSLDTRRATLVRRRYPFAPAETIDPAAWAFARLQGGVGLDMQGADTAEVPCDQSILLRDGFRPGWIYQLGYEGHGPLVLGLGHAAVRDLISFLRHDPASPLAGIERAYGWGRSQTGRAIRDFLYRGFNADTQGRRVFDGLLPHVSGAGRLHMARFANLTVPAGQHYEDHLNPADTFPFAYAETTDHLTGARDAILKHPASDPKLIHTQSSTEYWQRHGALTHTTTDGQDLGFPANARGYLWAGSQHVSSPLMGAPTRGICQLPENVVATSALFRGVLDALDAWVSDGVEPPPSQVPTRADGTLVDAAAWAAAFPAIPGVALPHGPSPLCRVDFSGPAPVADRAAAYTVCVPAVDADGNERGGVRAPMAAAPLATTTGWNLRARGFGHGAMFEFSGATIAFPDTEDERAMTADPRPSTQARYPDSAAYQAAIRAAAEALAAARLIPAEDVPRAEAAAANWGAPRFSVDLP